MTDKRQDIITAAFSLFYKNGFHATGVDLIMQTAKVSKRTLYKYFRSKDELVIAVLEDYNARSFAHTVHEVESRESEPGKRILAIFDVEKETFMKDEFMGCLVLNALSEYGNKNSAIEAIFHAYKKNVENYISDLLEKADAKNPAKLARQITMVLDGAITHAHFYSDPAYADEAKEVVEALL